MGAISFARGEDAAVYQGFDVSLVGIRGLLGPLLGFHLLSRLGILADFAVAGILFLLAAAGCAVHIRARRSVEAKTLRAKDPDI